jgi:hypothetical protein
MDYIYVQNILLLSFFYLVLQIFTRKLPGLSATEPTLFLKFSNQATLSI